MFKLEMFVISFMLGSFVSPHAHAQDAVVADLSPEEMAEALGEAPKPAVVTKKETVVKKEESVNYAPPEAKTDTTATAPAETGKKKDEEKESSYSFNPSSLTWEDKPKTSYLVGAMGMRTGQYPFAGGYIGHMGRDGDVEAGATFAGYGRDYFVFEGGFHYTGRNFGGQDPDTDNDGEARSNIFGAGALIGGQARIGTSGVGSVHGHLGVGGNANLGTACRVGIGPVFGATYANGYGEDRIRTASGEDKPADGSLGSQYDSGKETAGLGAGGDLNGYCDFGPLQLRTDVMAHSNFLRIDSDNPNVLPFHGMLKAQYMMDNGLIIGAHGQVDGSFLNRSQIEADLRGGKQEVRADISGMLVIGGAIGGDERKAIKDKDMPKEEKEEKKSSAQPVR